MLRILHLITRLRRELLLKEKPYVCAVRWFRILRKSKFVGGTKESLPLEGKVDRAARRMRCSRKAAFLLFTAQKITDAPHPTPHQSPSVTA